MLNIHDTDCSFVIQAHPSHIYENKIKKRVSNRVLIDANVFKRQLKLI